MFRVVLSVPAPFAAAVLRQRAMSAVIAAMHRAAPEAQRDLGNAWKAYVAAHVPRRTGHAHRSAWAFMEPVSDGVLIHITGAFYIGFHIPLAARQAMLHRGLGFLAARAARYL